MGAALRGLTTRGRSFLAAGAAAGLAAVVLGERDLLRVAALLVVLPLLAAWYVSRARHRLGTRRVLEPPVAPAGTPTRVHLHLHNDTRLPTGTLMLEETLPPLLGGVPRLVLERLGPDRSSTVAYTVRPEHRGRYPIGPLRVRLTDPFGLCRLEGGFSGVDPLTVVPRVETLPRTRLHAAHAGSGDGRGRSAATQGEDDTATREYRHGDDLRRIHWRSTARTGELMVRREEQPWERRATVLLDNRAGAHLGGAADGTLEWAVAAAASLTVHLRRGGHTVRLVCAPADVAGPGAPPVDIAVGDAAGEAAALRALADVEPRRGGDLGPLVAPARRSGGAGLTVAVLGRCDAAAAGHLLALPGRRAGVALVPDAGWPRPPGTGDPDAGVALLRRAGWQVRGYAPGQPLAPLWASLAAPAVAAAGGPR
ncbi:MAG TPA: DUF58 domain-containing protein [Pilimelia sp.]|nr:DUF58 domain-containing protein [Pilimelia sp.]